MVEQDRALPFLGPRAHIAYTTCLDHENRSGEMVEILEHVFQRLLSMPQNRIGIGFEKLPELGVVHRGLAVGLAVRLATRRSRDVIAFDDDVTEDANSPPLGT